MRIWIEKQRNILDFTLSSLLRRKGKNSALMLVYTLLVFLLASVMFFTQALRREAAIVLQGAPELIVQRMSAGRHDLVSSRSLDEIRAIRGVQNAKGRLWGYYFDPVTRANYTLLVPASDVPEPETIVIGEGLSRERQAFPGDILPFRAYDGTLLPFMIARVLPQDAELVSSDLILMGEGDFRRLFSPPPGTYTDIVVQVRNPKEVGTIAAKIARRFPDARPVTRQEILRTYDTIFDWRSGIIVVLLAAAVLAFVIFAWDKASGLSAEEKREIGILKAIGWETNDVLLMKFWEGMVVSLTSFLAGLLLAYVHVFFTRAVLFEPVLKGWSTFYPRFRLVPFIDPYQISVLLFLTVVPYTVATIIPSWRAATIDPDAVMRGSS